MADVTIFDLTSRATPLATDEIEIQVTANGASYKATLAALGSSSALFPGISDTCTVVNLAIADAVMTLGNTGAFNINRNISDQALIISGGTSGSLGAAVRLWGEAHANASDLALRADGNNLLFWDESQGDLEFLTGVGVKATALTLASTGAATFEDNVTVLGTFTSSGIDDNATGERLQLTNASMNMGNASADYAVTHKSTTNTIWFGAGVAATPGSNMLAYGSTHANALDLELRAGANTFMAWDESIGRLEFLTGVGVKANTFEVDGSGVSYNSGAQAGVSLPGGNAGFAIDGSPTGYSSLLATDGALAGSIDYNHTSDQWEFYTGGGGYALAITIDSSQNVHMGSVTTEAGRLFVNRLTGGTIPGLNASTVATFVGLSSASSQAHINIISGATGIAAINFGDTADSDVGSIQYNNSTNKLSFIVNTAEAFNVDSVGTFSTVNKVTIGDNNGGYETGLLNLKAPAYATTFADELAGIGPDGAAWAYTPAAHELSIQNNNALTGTDSYAALYLNAGAKSAGGTVGTCRLFARRPNNTDADVNMGFWQRNLGITFEIDGETGAANFAGDAEFSGNVGIGSVASASIPLKVTNNDTGTNAQLLLTQDGTGDAGMQFSIPAANWMVGVDNSASDVFVIGTGTTIGSATVLTLASSGDATFAGNVSIADGLSFPATQVPNADANTLDDYEEGTWTPVFSDGTNDMTMSTQVGYYTKVGRMVHVRGRGVASSLGSVTGNIQIDGLPFTAQNVGNGRNTANVGQASGMTLTSAGRNVTGHVVENTDVIALHYWTFTSGTGALPVSQVTSTLNLVFEATYYV